MTLGATMIVWAEPVKNGGMRLAPGDVREAIAWFKKKTKKAARLIVLNPKNEHYAKEAGEDIAVEYLAGCLTWEVWLSADNSVVSKTDTILGDENDTLDKFPSPAIMHTINGGKIPSVHNSTAALDKKPVSKRGPKHRADLPEKLIMKWAADEGMGSKAIASRLKRDYGISVHYSTIQRILNGQRVMV